MWLVYILISAVLLAAWILMLRRDVMHEPNTQVFALYPLAAIVLLPILSIITGEAIEYSVLFTWTGALIAIKTAAIAISLFAGSLALQRLPLTVIAPLRNVNPLFVAFLAYLLLGESLSPINMLGLVILVLAVILLDVDIRHPKNVREFGKHMRNPAAILVILASFIISFSPLLDRIIIERTTSFTNIFYFMSMLVVFYWIVHIIKTKRLPTQDISIHEILWILISGVTILMADIMYFLALADPRVFVAVIIGVRRLSNLFLTIFGGAILHEDHAVYKGVICLIMIGGTILLVL